MKDYTITTVDGREVIADFMTDELATAIELALEYAEADSADVALYDDNGFRLGVTAQGQFHPDHWSVEIRRSS